MNLEQTLVLHVKEAVLALYGVEAQDSMVQIQKTKKEFEGNLTVVVFPFVKMARKAPVAVAEEIGEWLMKETSREDAVTQSEVKNSASLISKYNAVQGFLNLTINPAYWVGALQEIAEDEHYGVLPKNGKLMMIEYSSPNTNKPLHLGHVRNNLLGYSLAKIEEAAGWNVVKTNIVNDRGIHICKSMLAWKLFGNGETPESTGKKGDHLIGDYYVRFDKEYRAQIAELKANGMDEETAKKEAPLMKEAQAMLLKWEQGDPEIRQLWAMMNGWVYAGFDETYQKMGVSFDKIYYESNTYLEGKSEVERGLESGIFFKKENGSVWADLTNEGLDEKLLLRADGTSVYMTQDIGTAKLRYQDYPIDKMVYVVGNEQEYHFKVLSILLDRLGFRFGKDLVHFSYGMVELPNGKMKSREGTVVDADDLMAQMIEDAKAVSEDKVLKLTDITPEEQNEIARVVGLGALKYFILKVDPRRNMLFNPEESIDFNGNTGPFIQYTYARIKSVLRKTSPNPSQGGESFAVTPRPLEEGLGEKVNDKEIALIQHLAAFPDTIKQAADDFSPALIANYAYELVKQFNQFYHDYSILGEEDEQIRAFRLMLSKATAKVIAKAMSLLGIEVPERM